MPRQLVAVVTPTYNGSRFLAETMDSVQAQTWPNLVHVVLDNNSSDGTPGIIERYRGGRVPLIVERNSETLRQRDNWNRAFSLVPPDAAYVRLLCDDDTITPDSIDEMMRVAALDPRIGVVGCLHDCAGAVRDFFWPREREVFDGIEAVRMTLLGDGIVMPVQMMWSKRFVDARKPLFDDDLLGGFDLDATLDMMARGKFGFVHKCLGFTRVHENTVTSQTAGEKTRAWTRDALDLIRKYGPRAFGDDYPARLLCFRRYYIRRILVWRRQDGSDEHLGIHFDALERAGWAWGPALVADALFGLALQKVGLYENWSGYPGWQ